MGEVWRASDTTLGRHVAIKLLPDAFARDAERLARFDREARLLASLNHPGIASIYGLHESDGVRFLAMELVPGEDLSARLARGPIPLDEAMAVARQIADALDAAHEQGIIHRDLKPANVKLTDAGKAKVLDFGLAKAFDPHTHSGSAALSFSPTVTAAATVAGVVLGTAAYMSPEQARGRAVDRRADVWAFGCLLYEMLTGERLFNGESISDILADVLRKEIDWKRLPPETPPGIRRLLRRCLERDPARRLRSAADAALEITAVLEEPPEAVSTSPVRAATAHRWRVATAVLGLAVIALTATVVLRGGSPPPPQPLRSFAIPGAGIHGSSSLAVSPDGSSLVYYQEAEVGGGSLLLRRLDDFNPRVLVQRGTLLHPFFSPDGSQVAFASSTPKALMAVPLAGGAPREIVPISDSQPGLWLEDGSILATNVAMKGRYWRGLARVPASGGDPIPFTTLKTGETVHFGPSLLPGGRQVLFTIEDGGGFDVAVADVATGAHRTLLHGSSPVYVPTGHLLSYNPLSLQVLAVPFDPVKAEVRGTPVTVVENVQRGINGVGAFALGPDGTFYYTASNPDSPEGVFGVVWASPGEKSVTITGERSTWAQPRLSPDGRTLLVRKAATPNCTLWLHDLERGAETRFTFEGDAHDALWHPDGRRIYFSLENENGVRQVSMRRIDEDGPAHLLHPPTNEIEVPRAISLDGTMLAVSRTNPETGGDIWIYPLVGGEPRPFVTSPFNEDSPAFSPDGRWIAYTSNESGAVEVYVRPWPSTGEKFQVSIQGGNGPLWSRDGRSIVYVENRRILAVDVQTGSGFKAGRPRLFVEGNFSFTRPGNYDLAADGRRMVLVERSGTALPTIELRAVQGWTRELARRVPVSGSTTP